MEKKYVPFTSLSDATKETGPGEVYDSIKNNPRGTVLQTERKDQLDFQE
jgi:hypothetical protein